MEIVSAQTEAVAVGSAVAARTDAPGRASAADGTLEISAPYAAEGAVEALARGIR